MRVAIAQQVLFEFCALRLVLTYVNFISDRRAPDRVRGRKDMMGANHLRKWPGTPSVLSLVLWPGCQAPSLPAPHPPVCLFVREMGSKSALTRSSKRFPLP
jgi:hypothetical protein